MIRVYKMNSHLVDGIFRVDDSGRLRYAYPHPYGEVATKTVKEIADHCHMTGKSVFTVVRKYRDGRDRLIIACPVYTVQGKLHMNPSNKYSGLIIFSIPLNRLQKVLFASAMFGKNGYPWMIDEKELLVSTANNEHIGKRFDEFLSQELSEKEQSGIRAVLAH